MKRCLLTWFIVCFSFAAIGQSANLIFKKLNRSSGLPVDQVNCIVSDSVGFIWIGTSEGLYKYDGFYYKQVHGVKAGEKNILNSQIADMYVSKEGLIWATVSYGGIVVLKSSGQVLSLCNTASTPGFLSDRAHRILQDATGSIWCSTDAGLYELGINQQHQVKVIRHIDLKKRGHDTNILGDFCFDEKGNIWLGTFTGLVIYNKVKDELYHRFNNPSQEPLLKDSFASRAIFMEAGQQKIWYSNWQPSLKIYDQRLGSFKIIYEGSPSGSPDYGWMVHNFFKDSRGRLWLTTGKGVYLAKDDISGIQQQFTHEPAMHTSVADNNVRHMHEDKEGNFWFATDNGISIANPYGQRFVNLSLNVSKTHAFADKYVAAIITVDSNTLLICTHGADGIYETDQAFNIRKHYNFHNNDYDWVWEFYEDKKNSQIFISTQKGMLRYDTKTYNLQKLQHPPFDQFYPVTSFIGGNDGKLWMSRYNNEFIEYDLATKKWIMHRLPDYGLKPQQMKIAKDLQGHLWIMGNATGLYEIDHENKKVLQKLEPQKNTANALLQSEVIFFKDLGDVILLGYDQKGFSLFHKKDKSFTHYNKSNGLAGNRVNDALLHTDNNIWIATSNGLNSFDLRTRELVAYNYDDGIINNNIFFLTMLNSGLLAAGTAKGLVTFDPSLVKKQVQLPAPFVTDITVYGNQLMADSLLDTGKPLIVSHQENYFSLNYISLQYSHQLQIEYAYMLEGFDKEWIAAGNRRFVSYANLRGGDYIFRLKARLPGGSWTESKLPLNIQVTTIFYKRWWFIPLCALVLIAILYLLFRYRLQQLIRLEKMRTAISSDLHDEVGATLSSISIFSEMARQNLPNQSKAEPYLQRIGERSRDSIEKMSDIIWSINPAHDSLQEMLSRMKTFVNENVDGKDIAVHWHESDSIANLKLGMLQRKNFYLLFKEAIINAVKYADASNISVQLSATQKKVALEIKDDGKGFNMETVKMGNGIQNIRSRAQQLHGIARIQSVPGEGTTVFVEFEC
jgi:ligand-binding sensor domain-containing protein/two-component sensor histidine kinase